MAFSFHFMTLLTRHVMVIQASAATATGAGMAVRLPNRFPSGRAVLGATSGGIGGTSGKQLAGRSDNDVVLTVQEEEDEQCPVSVRASGGVHLHGAVEL